LVLGVSLFFPPRFFLFSCFVFFPLCSCHLFVFWFCFFFFLVFSCVFSVFLFFFFSFFSCCFFLCVFGVTPPSCRGPGREPDRIIPSGRAPTAQPALADFQSGVMTVRPFSVRSVVGPNGVGRDTRGTPFSVWCALTEYRRSGSRAAPLRQRSRCGIGPATATLRRRPARTGAVPIGRETGAPTYSAPS